MIISHGRRYIFVHAPKTGGTSLALALEARAMKDDVMLGDTPKALRRRRRLKDVQAGGRLWKHSTLCDIAGLVTPDQMRDYFVFTLVRNPWDRMVSYYHWLQAQSFDHPAVSLARSSGFADFLRAPKMQASFRAAPYASYVTDREGREYADLFVRLEHLDEDLPVLEAHLGFSLRPLPHENRSDRQKEYRQFYTDELRQIVARCCHDDIERFGYVFE
ncbi:Sulfotransferase family protein [Aliiroseovarius crassostreae]|uniref:Type II secretory pathway, pullulanase PulA n=1 Tax=Aliiroseovarius crassostreae TaxID=154981 RepID=A0A0P7KKR4_9RHOB|nr:sulfotransferase family 2 domain-containing protein [Aliiroseovarius crassostreae]KPN64516.1 Type II secretory pathway, pullulanase PulA [Aliiroseovarius crassostreae]SFU36544.1 Sulfotransferase family protein [Aliiroseovarius crassostreae]